MPGKEMLRHRSLETARSRHAVVLSQSAFGCFFVDGGQVVASLFHHLDNLVKAHGVASVGKGRVETGVHGAYSCIGIAFDAWYLHQTAHGVAGHAKVVLKTHLSGILYLSDTATEELVSRSRSHSTGYAYLALTTHFCSRDRGILLYHIAKESACSQRTYYLSLGEVMFLLYLVEHSGITPHEPQVGAVTISPPEALTSATAKA